MSKLKRYEVWLNGKLIADYTRRGDAENRFIKLCDKHGRSCSCWITDTEDGFKVIINEKDYFPQQ